MNNVLKINKPYNTVKNSYDETTCRVIHGRQLSDAFLIRTGVTQGCLLAPFLFLLVIDWITKVSTEHQNNGIKWTPNSQLEDLDYADDLALLSHAQHQMQEKTRCVAENSERLDLCVNKRKPKLLKINTVQYTAFLVHGLLNQPLYWSK